MRDARSSQGSWTRDIPGGVTAEVFVKGVPGSHRSTGEAMAILQVEPPNVPFQIGWKTDEFPATEYYSEPAQTRNGQLAMAVGNEDVTFVVRPRDGNTPLTIKHVATAPENDPRYSDIPRY